MVLMKEVRAVRTPVILGVNPEPEADTGYALLVGEPDRALSDALGSVLCAVRCPAGGAMTCPAMQSQTCAVRAHARVTVVFVTTGKEEQRRVTCLAASDAPVVAVIEGSDLEPRVFGRFGVVGDASGSLGVLSAISGVIEGGQQTLRWEG